ncbi:MAG: cytochrome P450 [Actinomycetota bacterium]|nr:cytochrome P450 [Actinomycetota bacterium]
MTTEPGPSLADLAADPHPHLARLRSTGPVSWIPALDGWLVTDRATALNVMRDDATFTVDDPRFSTAQVVGRSMLSVDGAEHDRHRSAFSEPFRAGAVRENLGPWLRDEARRIVKSFADGGCAELRGALAAPLAVSTVLHTLGLSPADPDRVLGWYRTIGTAIEGVNAGREVDDGAAVAVAGLRARIDETVAHGSGPLADAAGMLDADAVFANAAVIMFGAIETSEGTTASALLHLLSSPEQLAEVLADRTLVTDVVEEALRIEPAASLVDRYATRDVEVAGVNVRQGDLVTVSLAGANRDPAVFDDPDRFDLHRANARQHLTFVQGPHVCLGMHLARLETREAVDAVLDLLPGVRLVPGHSAPARGLVFRKPGSVGAAWDVSRRAPTGKV